MKSLVITLLFILAVSSLSVFCYVSFRANEPATKVTPVYIEYNPSNHNDGLVLVYDPDTGDCKVINITHPSK